MKGTSHVCKCTHTRTHVRMHTHTHTHAHTHTHTEHTSRDVLMLAKEPVHCVLHNQYQSGAWLICTWVATLCVTICCTGYD